MLMLTRRLQILLDEDRFRRLEAEAARRRVAVAVVVRDALDVVYPATTDERAQAARLVLEAAPMPVPTDPAALRVELDTTRDRR